MGVSPEDEISVLHTDDESRTENVTDDANAAAIKKNTFLCHID
jgi:hypothetical protein